MSVYSIDPANSVFSIVPKTLGKVTINAFSLELDTNSAVDIVYTQGGMSYHDGMLHFTGQATNLTICDLTGRVLLSMPVCTEYVPITGKGMMIATANIDGKVVTLKVIR